MGCKVVIGTRQHLAYDWQVRLLMIAHGRTLPTTTHDKPMNQMHTSNLLRSPQSEASDLLEPRQA